MPRIRQIDRWNEDPEYSALPAPEKQVILENYFDKNLADSDFQRLPPEEKTSIRSNFASYHMPSEAPPAPIEQPPQPEETMREQIGRLGAKTGEVAALGLRGAAEGLTTELPGMAGRAMEFVGSGIPGDITETMRETTAELGGDPSRVPDFSWGVLEEVGRDLGDWAEAKKLQWFGPPKKRKGLERVVYEGSKMIAPSVLPGVLVGKGIKILSGVGGYVKASKAASIAGNTALATELMDKANKLAGMAKSVASLVTGGLFGLSQAQQTRDTAEDRAIQLESQGKFEEAKKIRDVGEGWAPLATGAIEGIGETAGTWAFMKFLGLDKAGIIKRGAKDMVYQFLKETLGVEVTTEVLQQVGQSSVEKYTGIRPEADQLAEALDVIAPTVFMSFIVGGGSVGLNAALREEQAGSSINILDEAREEVAPEREAVNVNLIKRQLKEFREEVTGPSSTAEQAAEVLMAKEARDRHQLQRLGLQVPEYKSAEEAGRVFEDVEEIPERLPVEPAIGPPSTAREAAETLVGPGAVQEEMERERIEREGLPVPEEAGREQIERLGLRVPEVKPAEEAARVFEEEEPVTPPPPTALTEKEKAIPEPKEIDAAANEAATSPLNDVPQPTEAQKKAGTYKKGHVNIQGLDISIENPKGSKRTGKDSDGETWETKMKSHYGYIKGTVGKDKDHIDIFIGDSPKKENVYVVDQINPETGEFDEHKALIGFDNMRAARKGYRENYERGWKGLGAITKMPIDEFKEWAGDKAKTKLPLKYKEAKGAAQIREHERRVLREEKKQLEKEARQAAIDKEKEATRKELEKEGRPDIQLTEEARRKARDKEPALLSRVDVETAIKKGQFVPPNILKKYPGLVKPEEIIEKPEEKYAVAEEEKPEAVPRTQELIESVFPGQDIKEERVENKDRYVVTLKNGLKVNVERVIEIVPKTQASLIKGYGKEVLDKGEYIAGVYIHDPKSDETSQIKIATKAGKKTLHHESIHFLEDFGIITKQEAGRINRHIKQKGLWDKSKSANENRAEWLADEVNKPAPASKLGKIWNKIKEFVNNLVNKLGIRTVGGVVQEIKTGKIYEKGTAPGFKPTEQYTVEREGTPTEESEEQPGLLRRQWDEIVYNMQDKFHYLNKAQMEAERKKRAELPEEQDAYAAETRYSGIVGAAIEDFEEEYTDPIFDVMVNNDIEINEADEYLHARHAKEANEELKRRNPDKPDNEALSGMTGERADLILDYADGLPNAAAYKELGRLHDRMTKAHRDILVESGQNTRETIQQWDDTYKFYAPLFREGQISKMPRRGRGFDVSGTQKIRAGSTRKVVNVMAHTVANTKAAIIRADKLKVARAFLKFAQDNPGPWKLDTVEYAPRFNKEGLIEYKPDPSMRWADNVMIVKEGGVNHRIVFDESNLNAMRIASAMKNLDAGDIGTLTNVLLKTNRYLAMVNTALNPEFIISNFLRDLQTAGYNMSDSAADAIRMKAFKDVKSAWRGIRQFQKGDKNTEWAKWYNRFRKAGGKVGWMQDYADVPGLQKDMIKKLEHMKADKKITIRRGLNSVIKFIEQENTAVENAVRLSVFKNLIENDVSESKAAVIAKELTVNFNRKGNMGLTLNAMYLFYNASIQGSARLISAARTSPKVRKMMAGTVAFAAALDVINRAVGGVDDDGEDRYDKIAPWVKERNMIIMLPDGKGYVKIILPWGYNIFHVMGQVAGEAISKKDFDPLEGATRVAGATISSFNPVGGEASILQVLSPTLTDPIVQWAENKDWAGRKLRPDTNVFAPKPSSQTYWNSVREPSKAIAEKINELTGGDVIKPGKIDISPELIDLAIDTFTGGAGKFVGNLISAPIKMAKEEELEAYEIPILRRVYGKIGKQALTQEFYENIDAVQLVRRQYKHYLKDKKKLKEIRKQNPAEIKMLRHLEKRKSSISRISRGLSKLRKRRNAAMKAGNRQKVDELNSKIELVMRKFNKRYLQYKRKEKVK